MSKKTKLPTLHVESAELKLDLGGGENVRAGFECVDFFAPTAKYKVNLLQFPWPWADNSVSEIHCSHFIEHIPMVYAPKNKITDALGRNLGGNGGYKDVPTDPGDRDLLCLFMDECWRVLKPNATMTVFVPAHRNDRAFQDPTHRRFITPTTFGYFNKMFRDVNKLGHYLCNCNFDSRVDPIVPNEMGALSPEVAQRRVNHEWNHVLDWQAILKAVK